MNRPALTFVLAFVVAALAAAAAITAGMRAVTAAPSTLLEQADYTFSCPHTNELYQCDPGDVLPDSSVWTADQVPSEDTGSWCVGGGMSVAQCAWAGGGLLLVDPGNGSQLLYTYHPTNIAADPSSPAHYNTAKFRVVSSLDYVSNGSGAWSAEAIGWRMIFDDGSQRLELKLGRTITGERMVFVGNSAITPISFPWDSTIPNIYEIERHSNGDFTVTVTNGDISSSNPTQTRYVPAGMLSSTQGTPLIAWGMGYEGGGVAGFHDASLDVNRPTGSISGKGAIASPAGAMFDSPDAAGPARFSLSAKFAKGLPSGQVAFDFKDGNLSFASTSIDSLRLTGNGAEIFGRGTVNGAGNYRFALRAVDGQAAGGTGTDAYHLRIWDPATYTGHNATYDNQPELDPWWHDATWPLSGGSITVR